MIDLLAFTLAAVLVVNIATAMKCWEFCDHERLSLEVKCQEALIELTKIVARRLIEQELEEIIEP